MALICLVEDLKTKEHKYSGPSAMLSLKKYLTEGLLQFTILLSLIGVRVDVDTYLTSQLPSPGDHPGAQLCLYPDPVPQPEEYLGRLWYPP